LQLLELLLLQRGKELNYAMGDEQFKSIIDNIKKENKIETDEQFAETMLYRPGQALVSMAGSVAVVKARMDRSPCKLTVYGGDK
jgi:hypothetical protein